MVGVTRRGKLNILKTIEANFRLNLKKIASFYGK